MMARVVLALTCAAMIWIIVAHLARPGAEHQADGGPPAAKNERPHGAPNVPMPVSAPALPPTPGPKLSPVLDILPPMFRSMIGAPQVDPRLPGYDALAAFDLRGGGGADVLALFRDEPRDPTWASEREADIVDQALPEFLDVDRDARMDVECHTATCRVRIHSRNPVLTRMLGDYPLACLANSTVPLGGPWGAGVEDPFSDIYMVFGPDVRERDGFLVAHDRTCARYREQWQQMLERTRSR
ncbi:MAG TPA: hypothetical protein VN253_09270 [Kofleriaceae bacterium]|nr:hypothetical protein [Kofleriaceae bacterium]